MLNKYIVQLLLVAMIMISCKQHVITEKQERYIIKVKEAVGYIDSAGKVAIPPQFEDGKMFSESLAPVKIGGKWGYIDQNGKIIINPQFEEAKEFSDNLAAVKLGKWGFIDKGGKFCINPMYYEVTEFSNGVAVVQDRNEWGSGKTYAIINKEGKVVKSNLTYAEGVSDGLILTNEGYLDVKGKVKVNIDTAKKYWSFKNGNARFRDDNGNYGFIDLKGSIVIPATYSDAGDFSEGYASVKIGGLYGYIDKNNKIAIKPYFAHAHPFSNGIARVEVLGGRHKTVYINVSGISIDCKVPILDGKDFVGELAEIETTSTDVQVPGDPYPRYCGSGMAYINKRGELVWHENKHSEEATNVSGIGSNARYSYTNDKMTKYKANNGASTFLSEINIITSYVGKSADSKLLKLMEDKLAEGESVDVKKKIHERLGMLLPVEKVGHFILIESFKPHFGDSDTVTIIIDVESGNWSGSYTVANQEYVKSSMDNQQSQVFLNEFSQAGSL